MSPADATVRDWRETILASGTTLPGSPAIRCAAVPLGPTDEINAVVAVWQFASHGGSYGVRAADAFVAAVDVAIDRRLPLVTVLRSGGTRLDEGMRALVGIPRSTIALHRLRAAGLAHVTVADHPTTGGVWVSIGSQADIRIAIEAALIGFSGPRAVGAMTGRDLPAGANRATSAYDAGLVDLVVEPTGVLATVRRILATLGPASPQSVDEVPTVEPSNVDAWTHVGASRTVHRPDGAQLLTTLLSDATPLRTGGETVAARVGLLAGRPVVGVALAAARATMPTPSGFGLLARGARLAGALGLGLIVLIDSPGADPHTEADGLADAIATAMSAVLETPAPTVCLVHGEGGSGGALAGAVTDAVGVGAHGWFAALGPEGAAATLRIEPDAAARLMRITPRELLADGFADALVPAGFEGAWLAATLDRLADEPTPDRLARRLRRWSQPLPDLS